jgi:predicted transcriptional regulator
MKMKLKIDKRSGYSLAHAVKTIMFLAEETIGRDRLIRKLNLNEASVRTLLNRLEESGFVKKSNRGKTLTVKGEKFSSFLKKNIIGPFDVCRTKVTVSKYNIAYIVRKKSRKIRKGVEQRDQAIMMGAEGLTTITYDGSLHIPGLDWKVPDNIKNLFNLEKDDVILIGSAKSKDLADLAALNAALLLAC